MSPLDTVTSMADKLDDLSETELIQLYTMLLRRDKHANALKKAWVLVQSK